MTYYEESKNMFQNYQDTWDYYKMHNNTIIDVLPNRENILLLRQDQLIRKTSQFLSLSKRKCGLSKQVAFSLGFQCSESAKPPLRNFLPLARLRIYGANAPPPHVGLGPVCVFINTKHIGTKFALFRHFLFLQWPRTSFLSLSEPVSYHLLRLILSVGTRSRSGPFLNPTVPPDRPGPPAVGPARSQGS